jgi:mannose-6-phosphate isomerase
MPESVPQRLNPSFVERVWGRTSLAPLFPDTDPAKKFGEVWFSAGAGFPLLVKFLYTAERLSVQVHPDDDYANDREQCRGKTEMWHILSAEPGASIALGFRRQMTKDEVRAAVEDGSIEELLNWIPVRAGEAYLTEAGVVHAIGAGVTACEIQQNSDVTYRLYDYGRGRELHLNKALDVLRTDAYSGKRSYPVSCKYFQADLFELDKPHVFDDRDSDRVLIALEGGGTISGSSFTAGEVWRVPTGAGAVALQPLERARILLARCGSTEA